MARASSRDRPILSWSTRWFAPFRGAALPAKDLDDVEELLGHRPKSWQERGELLSELVVTNRGERDTDLARYLVRRIQREEAVLAPVQRDLLGARVQTLRLD